MDDIERLMRAASATEREREERELRRIAHHRLMGTATWDDMQREARLRRKRAERSFEETEDLRP